MNLKKSRQDSPLKVLEYAYREMCEEFLPRVDGMIAISKARPVDWIAMRRIDAKFSSLFAAAIVTPEAE
jgi:hypothetical protein